jgi:hypothetical protein
MKPEDWPNYNDILKLPVLLVAAGFFVGARAVELCWRRLRER